MAAAPLAPYAMDVRLSRGRRYPEPPHPYRADFARDRDRVIHSRAFRRLEAKTQVFTTRYSDHFRNRLTHTLEVAQIARTVADALRLNSDLAEALALVHDIGHPPFGHAGERHLDARMRDYGSSFDHNLHALRIVEQFEQSYLAFPGLNLTFEVREGIIKHSRDYSPREAPPELTEYLLDLMPPVEAQLIDHVDEIAYNTADLDDAFEARLLDFDALRAEVPLFADAYADVNRLHAHGTHKLKFSGALKSIVDHLATDLIENTRREIAASGATTVDDIRLQKKRLAGFFAGTAAQIDSLKKFLHTHIYSHPAIVEDRERSVAALNGLFQFFMDNPDRMPPVYSELATRGFAQNEPRHRVVCDYIAGMTDHYLLRQCHELIGTKAEGAS
jgi:dGTPase